MVFQSLMNIVMETYSAMKIKTHHSPALRNQQDCSGGTTQQSASPAKGDRARAAKRKSSPEPRENTKRKRTSVLEEAEPCNTSDGRLRGEKQNTRGDGEGPSKRIKIKSRGLHSEVQNKESTSSSVDTGRERSGIPQRGCSASVQDVHNGGAKRKASDDGEGSEKKKTRNLKPMNSKDLTVECQRAQFEAKYTEQNQLGEGGCGSVFAGCRKADNLSVAIKHIPQEKVFCKQLDRKGKALSVEVTIMLKLAAAKKRGAGASAPVSLLDWYDLGEELILVLERPVPADDLLVYIEDKGGSLQEEEAKNIMKQLVDAAIDLQDKHIFHRDIKVENILIETGSNAPRVRLIDFGLSCFDKKRSSYRIFYGTVDHAPPEWYSHRAYRSGPATVWQIGVVLFETLHEEDQFKTINFLKTELRISSELSQNCQDFLQKCLSLDAEQRPTLKELRLHPWLI